MTSSRRYARRTGGFVLLWFLLSLGVAMASPLVQPRAMAVVCSVAGAVELVVLADEGARAPGVGHLDCPLCLPAGLALPPSAARSDLTHLLLPGRGLRPMASAHWLAMVAAPLPPRGPPIVS